MPRATRICEMCGKRVSTWWERDDRILCGPHMLEDLAAEGLIHKGQPNPPGWTALHQRRRAA